MTVVPFPLAPAQMRDWRPAELKQVLGACADAIERGEASGWEIGHTEAGDPQFYLIGRPPDRECLLCISRLGHLYVLEDGSGHILVEDRGLMTLARQMREALWRKKGALAARLVLGWYAVREAIEERTDAVLAESQEVLAHFAPQLAALV
jgi:hypothetical protein